MYQAKRVFQCLSGGPTGLLEVLHKTVLRKRIDFNRMTKGIDRKGLLSQGGFLSFEQTDGIGVVHNYLATDRVSSIKTIYLFFCQFRP